MESIRRRRRFGVPLVVMLCVATVSLGAASTAREVEWDPRLAPIARATERLRHLRFQRPIPARFLSDRAFRKLVTDHDRRDAKRERKESRIAEAELRALGLVGGSFDLTTTVDDVNASDIAAFYDSDKQEIVVRGTKVDAALRVTLAHELTHGLQDQHYDLDALQERAKTSDADDALTGLVEGDATRIEDAYYQTLNSRDQDVVDQADAANADPSGGVVGDGPANPDEVDTGNSFIAAELEAPYAIGPAMVDVILAEGHSAGLAKAFRRPPTTQLQMLQPALAATVVHPVRLSAPRPARGFRRVASGPTDLGALDLYFLLASRIPGAVALQAADGWGNGRDVVSERDHHICVDASFAGRNGAASRRIADAIRLWSAAMPAGVVTLGKRGTAFRACDPGRAAISPPNSPESALEFVAIRAFIESQMVLGQIPPRAAACLGDQVITRPDYQEFADVATAVDEPTKSDQAVIDRVLSELIDVCPG